MAASSQVGLNQIGQIAITVKDVARATEFYRDKLSMRYLFAAGNLAFFDCGGVRLMLSLSEQGQSGNSVLYFKVPDIRAAHQQMKTVGVQFQDEPHLIAKLPDHDLWMTFFRDSEDNLLGLMSEVREPA
jgi:methylmalonyl-CoA/ethylmalonyl-CoA epimerase